MSETTVIVTGASRGIGAETARAFAAAGANVVLTARSAGAIEELAAELTDAGGTAIAVTADVAEWDDVAAAVERTMGEFGRLDVMVNNAGVIEPIAHLADSDPAAWRHAADINATGTYHGIRAALPPMLEAGTGVIVNVSSGAAYHPLEGWSHYCSAKAAAAMLTRCAELETPDGIRVVGLSPGTVDTQMQIEIKASGVNPVSQLDRSDHIPPEWVGRAIVWLASDDATDLRGIDVQLGDDTIRRRIGLD